MCAGQRPAVTYCRSMRGYTQDKDAYLKRLRRIEGQVRGLQRMVEEDVYCIDVLTQVSAVTRALQAVALGLLEDHLGACVTDAGRKGGDEGAESVREAAAAITRLVRSSPRSGPNWAKAARLAVLSPRLSRQAHSRRIEDSKPIASAGLKLSSE